MSSMEGIAAPAQTTAAAQPARVTRDRLTLCGVGLVVLGMLAVARQWADYDLFWHLANGRLMSEAGLFPSPDRFSWSAAGAPYLAYSAQVDRLFYLIWRTGGVPALGTAAALLFGLSLLPFVVLIGRCAVRWRIEAIAVMAIMGPLLPFRGARPHAVGFVLFAALVYLLERPFGRRKALLAGLALGVWANAHGTFLIGFGYVGAAVIAWLAARDRQSAAAAGLALAGGFGLSLLSPYGLQLWLKPFATVAQPALAAINQDWVGLRPFSPESFGMGILLLVALGVGVWKSTSPRAIAALGLILPTVQIARFTPFTAPLLALLILERLVERAPGLAAKPHLRRGSSAPAVQRRWATLALLGACLPVAWAISPRRLEAAAPYALPVAAVERLLACGDPAPVWSDYNWSGYLLWRGEARYSVGIDGRGETLYSADQLASYLQVVQGSDGWQRIVQQSPAQYALIPVGSAANIGGMAGWLEVYRDDLASLAVRNTATWRCT